MSVLSKETTQNKLFWKSVPKSKTSGRFLKISVNVVFAWGIFYNEASVACDHETAGNVLCSEV